MRLSPFMDALRGLAFMLRTQRHAQFHAVTALAVGAVGLWLRIEANGWCWLVAAMAMVMSAEAFNTAIERLADRITTQRDALIGQAKDLAAGAVLCAAIGAAVIGSIVLGPPLWARVFG
jgi:diacylglycerol kinase